VARVLDEDELIEHWTLVGDELDLLTGRTGPSKLGLALWLKFFAVEGRFPAGRSELPDEAVGWVASQVKVPASDLGLFDWEGRTAERHRKTVRTFLGFRECSVADAEKLTAWLAEEVCSRERRAERVREALLAQLREERIEQPGSLRLGRMIGSALRQSEETLTVKVSSRLDDEVTARMWSMIAAAGDDPGDPAGEGPEGWQGAADGNEPGEVPGPEVWAAIRADPGSVSLNTCKSERRKLDWIRAVGLPSGLFADIAPKIVAGWRARAAVESPSHLRNDHSDGVRWTLLAAYLHCREREITDGLVELLIATVHRINARAETRTREQFVADIARKVTNARHPGGGRRRARPRRGRAALRPAPLHHGGVVPAGRPGNRQRDVRRPPGVAVGRGLHRGGVRLDPLQGVGPEHLHRVAFALPERKTRGAHLLDGG